MRMIQKMSQMKVMVANRGLLKSSTDLETNLFFVESASQLITEGVFSAGDVCHRDMMYFNQLASSVYNKALVVQIALNVQ